MTSPNTIAMLSLASRLLARDLLRFQPAGTRVLEPLARAASDLAVAFEASPEGWRWWAVLRDADGHPMIAPLFDAPELVSSDEGKAESSLMLGVPTETEAIRGLIEIELDRLSGSLIELSRELDDLDDTGTVVIVDKQHRVVCRAEDVLRGLQGLGDAAKLGSIDPEPGTVWGTIRGAEISQAARFIEPTQPADPEPASFGKTAKLTHRVAATHDFAAADEPEIMEALISLLDWAGIRSDGPALLAKIIAYDEASRIPWTGEQPYGFGLRFRLAAAVDKLHPALRDGVELDVTAGPRLLVPPLRLRVGSEQRFVELAQLDDGWRIRLLEAVASPNTAG